LHLIFKYLVSEVKLGIASMLQHATDRSKRRHLFALSSH